LATEGSWEQQTLLPSSASLVLLWTLSLSWSIVQFSAINFAWCWRVSAEHVDQQRWLSGLLTVDKMTRLTACQRTCGAVFDQSALR
jgi:hypothetical protein